MQFTRVAYIQVTTVTLVCQDVFRAAGLISFFLNYYIPLSGILLLQNMLFPLLSLSTCFLSPTFSQKACFFLCFLFQHTFSRPAPLHKHVFSSVFSFNMLSLAQLLMKSMLFLPFSLSTYFFSLSFSQKACFFLCFLFQHAFSRPPSRKKHVFSSVFSFNILFLAQLLSISMFFPLFSLSTYFLSPNFS